MKTYGVRKPGGAAPPQTPCIPGASAPQTPKKALRAHLPQWLALRRLTEAYSRFTVKMLILIIFCSKVEFIFTVNTEGMLLAGNAPGSRKDSRALLSTPSEPLQPRAVWEISWMVPISQTPKHRTRLCQHCPSPS